MQISAKEYRGRCFGLFNGKRGEVYDCALVLCEPWVTGQLGMWRVSLRLSYKEESLFSYLLGK